VTAAFFLPRADGRYQATEHTSGPWDPRLQHAGPPAALIGRALERCEPRPDMLISRLTFEILHAVPVGEVEVSARVARPGRSVELLEASLVAGGREVVRTSAWRVLRAPGETASPHPYAPPPLPDGEAPMPAQLQSGYLKAIEWRPVSGGFLEPGPGTAWTRTRVPIVEDEEPSGLQRLMVLADCGNGVSNALPIGDWLFINPDLTVHLCRYPAGEWLCIDAATTADPRGFGVATSTLYDSAGRVAHGAQSLFINRR